MTATGVPVEDLQSALQEHFGLQSFRPLQRELITAVLAGQPAVGILPTGGGKSLCYQLPALLLPGVTLVISPLISLMKDQVDALVARGIRAVAINSQDTAAEGRRKLAALAEGRVKLAFVAPERLRNQPFLDACRRVGISLLAVDEAHCVSQWGHDFRPDYRFIRDFHLAIGAPPLLALTATARAEVREDIMVHLGIPAARVFSASAERRNLWLGLEPCATVAEKRGKVAHLAARAGGSTILYVSSRRDAETWAAMLAGELREAVAHYHAGMPPEEREAVQNRFMAGLCRVVVATNAFGMGIDKPDIRAVIHAGVPDSLEAYAQEVGRAGRDDLPAACTMVLVPGMDVKVREYLLGKDATAGADTIFRRIQALGRSGGGILPTGPDDAAVALLVVSHLQSLAGVELLQHRPDGLELRMAAPLTDAALAGLRSRLNEQEWQRRSRFQRMRGFVYLEQRCRREYLLRYFGERLSERPAACCSTCHPRPLPAGLAVATVRARRRRDGAGPAPAARPSEPQAAALLERLKQWRRAKAAAMQVPAYVVFGDRDLAGIAAAAPDSLDALAACRGVGPAKLQQYGAELLSESAAALRDAGTEAAADPPAEPHGRTAVVSHAAERFAAGQTVAQVAAAAGQPENAVWDAFVQWVAAAAGDAWKTAVRRVITPDDYRAIRKALQGEGDRGLAAAAERLGGRYSLEQLRVALAVLERVGRQATANPPI